MVYWAGVLETQTEAISPRSGNTAGLLIYTDHAGKGSETTLLVQILTAVAPILVALVGILPAINSNRKKTQTSIEDANKAMDKRIDKIQATLDAHIKEDEEDNVRNRRTRILRFYDEMCTGRLHSESHFEDIIDDIDEYEKYCEAHPNYKNNRGRVAMKYIVNTYDKLKVKGGFLSQPAEKEDDQ